MANDNAPKKTLKRFQLLFSIEGKGLIEFDAEDYGKAEEQFYKDQAFWIKKAKLNPIAKDLIQIKNIAKTDSLEKEELIDLTDIIIEPDA